MGSASRDAPGSPGQPAPLPASTWVGVAVVGALLFVLGIWKPAWQGVPNGADLSLLPSIAGGVLFVVGLTFAVRARRVIPTTPIEEMPGVEVYRPGARPPSSSEDPPP
jgi:hypothetical protein